MHTDPRPPTSDEPLPPAWVQVEGLAYTPPGMQAPLWSALDGAWQPGLGWVVGDEGSGKTTLLRLLAGELAPQAGRVERPPGDVFWVWPRAPLQAGLPARDWLEAQAPRHPRWDAAALQAHLQGWGLEDHLGKPLEGLSAGTWRKLVMAAGLASGAALACIDEPTAGLDLRSIRYLESALCDMAAATDRLVLVAHYEVLAGADCGDVLVLPQR